MPNTAPNPSGDEPVVNSHSGDEPKPQGAFKTINYDQNTGAADVKVTPASKAAQAMAAGEPVRQRGESADGTASADAVDDMTVEQLHEEATRLNIEGRSNLTTRDDLLKAIRKEQRKANK